MFVCCCFCVLQWAESRKNPEEKKNRVNEVTSQYAAAAKNVAHKLQCPCVDLFEEMLKSKDWRQFLNDGLHLSKKGNELVASLLLAAVQASFPHMRMEQEYARCSLPMDGPEWSAIDPNTPRHAFDKHDQREAGRLASFVSEHLTGK